MKRLAEVCGIVICIMMLSMVTVQAEPLYDFTLLIYMNNLPLPVLVDKLRQGYRANVPIALLPPPTQAATRVGNFPH